MKDKTFGWPLAAQMVALVVLAVLAAQAVNLIVVLTSPPPERFEFRLGEVADVLSGAADQEVRDRYSVSMAATPADDNREDPEELQLRQQLAAALHASPADVRVMLRGGGPPPGPKRPMPQGLQFGRGGPQDRFSASLRLADNRWRIVSARRQGWLDPWQERALIWFLMTVLVVCPLGWAFARRLAAPIRGFAAAAERLGRDPRAPPLTLDGPAEIGVAAAAFNQMQRRLNRYVEDRTTMIGAIAHDLRTPLTRLAFRLEQAPDALRDKARADIEEMQAMIAATLDFVRDATAEPVRQRLDLTALVESAADDLAAVGHKVSVEPGERVVLSGDPGGLRRMVTNLLDNGARYGGGAVARVRRDGGAAVIEVDDQGPGLPEHELTRVFEPFHRGEASRSRDTGGIGLGLAVVRTVAHAHGGEVALANRTGGGLSARVTLPL